ncbi:BEL1-like homeodomain 1 [Actinidia rufa]|uniref:BEL1-like homeodomain 1 n=1 Tax=Actinidia rufa TaxID=165716 RepID=A0A7J0G7L3_9ERIC|nr:BEL1-like homeodomain 1 [Actinidia rufa]
MANQGGEKHMKTNMVSSTGYNCFSHDSISQTHMLNQLQGYEPTPEIYNMATTDPSSAALWKGFFSHNKSSDFTTSDHSLAALDHTPTTTAWHVDDSTLRAQSSKYLSPAQEILSEFCNLGTKQTEQPTPKIKPNKSGTNQLWQDHENTSSSSSKKQSLCNLELLDLQRRKSKLLAMLEEVDRRYRHYCDQMKAVVSSFEEVAARDGSGVLGTGLEGDVEAFPVPEGWDCGGSPTMSIMDSHPWRPQRGLPERSVSVLRAWLFEHFLHP